MWTTHLPRSRSRLPLARRALAAAAMLLLGGCYTNFSQDTKTASQTTGQEAGPRSQAGARRSAQSNAAASKPRQDKGSKQSEKSKEPKQTYAEAWAVICHAEQKAAIPAGASRKQREAAVTSWIVQHLKNKKARYFFIAMGNMNRSERLGQFRAEARRAGFPDCPVAPLLFPDQ